MLNSEIDVLIKHEYSQHVHVFEPTNGAPLCVLTYFATYTCNRLYRYTRRMIKLISKTIRFPSALNHIAVLRCMTLTQAIDIKI